MAYDRKDHFYERAKHEGKASRAVYKLEELQKRFKLIQKGDCVLDLGCAPGGWLQEAAPWVAPKGKIIGIDLLPLKISPPKGCTVLLGDAREAQMQEKIQELAGSKVQTILSDMSPNLSGISYADAYRSYELACLALEICESMLAPQGKLVIKIFPGEETEDFLKELKTSFQKVSMVVPEATRKTSSERYIVATGFKKTIKPPEDEDQE